MPTLPSSVFHYELLKILSRVIPFNFGKSTLLILKVVILFSSVPKCLPILPNLILVVVLGIDNITRIFRWGNQYPKIKKFPEVTQLITHICLTYSLLLKHSSFALLHVFMLFPDDSAFFCPGSLPCLAINSPLAV